MADSSSGTTRKRPNLAWEWTKSLLIAVGIALLIRWPLIEPFKIPSGSMEPTLQVGDRLFVNKWIYGVRWPFNGFRIPFTRSTIWYSDGRMLPGKDPERWDIVVFKSNEDRVEKDTLVKRIVGMPGERILIRNGKVYANGVPLEFPPDMPEVFYTSPLDYSNGFGLIDDEAHSLVPEDHYLLLGDNSDQSRDGRWFGFMPNHHILGRVSSIWWPISRWRDFTGFSDSWWWNLSLVVGGGWLAMRLFVGRSWRVAEDMHAAGLKRGDRVFVRYSLGVPIPFTGYRIGSGRGLSRGDLVLYRSPERTGVDPDYLLGIVSALPGEKVQIKQDTLVIDGDRPAELPAGLALGESTGKYGLNKGKEFSQVPDRGYFILSDAGKGERDSRTLGFIPKPQIVGHASRVWWPIGNARSLAQLSGSRDAQ